MRRIAAIFLLALLIQVLATAPAIATPAPAVMDQAAWTGMKRSVRLANGIRLSYVELGDAEGSPLLLLHGWTDSSRSWSILAPQLLRHRLLIPDQRGHGGSDAPVCCYSISVFADDARLFLDALGVGRASLVGHSLGSFAAQRLAADHPQRVDRLVLIASTALAPVRRGDWLWTNVSALRFPLNSNSEFMRAWTAVSSPTPVDSAFVAHAVHETAAVPPHVWGGVLREITDLPVGRFAAQIKAPTLILGGGRDELFGPTHQRALLDKIPHALFRLFPALGHNLIWERPDEVGPPLARFLSRQASM